MEAVNLLVEKRIRDLSEWLEKNGGDCQNEQRHLNEGSQERVYWHYGYLIALKDVVVLLADPKKWISSGNN